MLIFGVTGACRCDELLKLNVEDVEDCGTLILIKIINTKTKKPRSFTIVGDFYLNLCRQYTKLRPKDFQLSRFFIKYQKGKCHKVVMGIHKISNTAKEVALYLNLSNPSEYTGHCLRRTSATILVDNGGDISCLKRHGGWKSSSVAEGYIEESITNKKETAKRILAPVDYNKPSTSKDTNWNTPNELIPNEEYTITNNLEQTNNKIMNIDNETSTSGFNMQHCNLNNCTFIINK